MPSLLPPLIALAGVLLTASLRAEAATVAVFPLDRGAGDATFDGLGIGLAGMITSDLAGAPGLVLVERQRIDALLGEIKLGEQGFLDPTTAARAGRGVGAELALVGSWTVIADQLSLDARWVEVSSGRVLEGATAHGPVSDFVAVEKELVEGLLADLGAALDAKDRRSFYGRAPTESFEAFTAWSRGLSMAQRGDLDAAKLAFDLALARDPEFADALQARADLATRLEALRAESRASQDARRDAMARQVLASTVDPRSVARGAPWTPDALAGLPVRWAVLLEQGRPCERAAEMSTFIERAGWRPGQVWAPHFKDLRAFRAAAEAKATALGWTPWSVPHPEPAVSLRLADREIFLFSDTAAFLLHRVGSGEGKGGAGLLSSTAACAGLDRAKQALGEWRKALDAQGLLGPTTADGDWTVDERFTLARAWIEASQGALRADTRATLEALARAAPEGDPRRAERVAVIDALARHAEQEASWLAHRLGYDLDALRQITRAIAAGKPPFRADEPRCAAAAQSGWTHEAARSLEGWQKDDAEGRRPFHSVAWAARLARAAGAYGCLDGERGVAVTWPEAKSWAVKLAARQHPAPPERLHCDQSRAGLLQLAALPDDSPVGPTLTSQVLTMGFTLVQLRCLVEGDR